MLDEFLGNNFSIMTFRILFAAFLSGVIGFEREIKKHPAGFRTHLLVGVGSCLMMLLSLYGFEDYITTNSNIRFDPSRIPSYVISGIGFLGAGTILVKGATVRGLTTAASIWVVAGIGLIVGVGMIAPALLTTLVVLLSLIFLNKFEKKIIQGSKVQNLNIILDKKGNRISDILKILEQNEVIYNQITIESYKNNKAGVLQKNIKIDIKIPRKITKAEIQDKISQLDFVHQIF